MSVVRYLFFALLLGGSFAALIYYEKYSADFFTIRNNITTTAATLKSDLLQLRFEVLKNSFFLYQNYDIITEYEDRIKRELATLKAQITSLQRPSFTRAIATLERSIQKDFERIERFKLLNSTIKNSTLYAPSLLQKLLLDSKHNSAYERLLLDTVASIFLAKSSLDPDFIKHLAQKIKRLEQFQFDDPDIARTHKLLIAHLNVYAHNFARYKSTLISIVDSPTATKFDLLFHTLQSFLKRETDYVSLVFKIVVFFFIVALGLILYILKRLDEENKLLEALRGKLYHQSITDDLTKLRNRRSFKRDVKRVKKPFLALIDIDGFKHYNDLYGNALGDHILRQSAHILRSCIADHLKATFYRIGSDEFVILIDETNPIDEERFAKAIINAFENSPITFKNISVELSVSVAMTRKRPLLETADMTLKYIKSEKITKFLTYQEEFGLFAAIKTNIKRTKELQAALQQGSITAHYQPIVSNKDGTIVKYEALARIKKADRYLSIFPYLQIAKELGLYHHITERIFSRSFELAHKRKISLSLNLSMNDIQNPQLLQLIRSLLHRYPEAASSISFEILESETLQDYRLIKSFIATIKALGFRVGIDDFGSGYSNFTHIFNLDVDFIKIDGSLIRSLDSNKTSRLIVEKITQIAQELQVETIAEFVHNETIYSIVKEIGIDYSQGFYIGEPGPL